MIGSEMLRMGFLNELNICLGLEFINGAELKVAATLLPLQVSVCVSM